MQNENCIPKKLQSDQWQVCKLFSLHVMACPTQNFTRSEWWQASGEVMVHVFSVTTAREGHQSKNMSHRRISITWQLLPSSSYQWHRHHNTPCDSWSYRLRSGVFSSCASFLQIESCFYLFFYHNHVYQIICRLTNSDWLCYQWQYVGHARCTEFTNVEVVEKVFDSVCIIM